MPIFRGGLPFMPRFSLGCRRQWPGSSGACSTPAIGDEVARATSILWGRPGGDPTARSHMLLRVTLPEGEFLADVGFGGVTLTAPLRLEIGTEQQTPHEPHRLVVRHSETELQARLDGQMDPALPVPAAAPAPDRLRAGELVHRDVPGKPVHEPFADGAPRAGPPLRAVRPRVHGALSRRPRRTAHARRRRRTRGCIEPGFPHSAVRGRA